VGSITKNVIILGAGGHAKVVAATAQEAGFTVKAFYDDDPAKKGTIIGGVPVIGGLDSIQTNRSANAIIAIGDNRIRSEVLERFQDILEWVTLVHPRSFVHYSVELGKGTVVFAGAIIQPDTVIAGHCIINTGATIDHDCKIDDMVHLGPGVNVAGNVHIGEGTLLGIGGRVIPGKNIGRWSIIGAGAAVVNDIPDQVVATGVPAKVRRRI